MPFTKMLQTVSLGLISLCGGLILVGLTAWLHYWIYGSLNPDKVRPLEDWSLALGITALLIQLASSLEALIISIGTRLRWIGYRRGRTAVGLYSLITLSYMLAGLWVAVSISRMDYEFFFIQLIILLLLGIAWFVLHFQHC